MLQKRSWPYKLRTKSNWALRHNLNNFTQEGRRRDCCSNVLLVGFQNSFQNFILPDKCKDSERSLVIYSALSCRGSCQGEVTQGPRTSEGLMATLHASILWMKPKLSFNNVCTRNQTVFSRVSWKKTRCFLTHLLSLLTVCSELIVTWNNCSRRYWSLLCFPPVEMCLGLPAEIAAFFPIAKVRNCPQIQIVKLIASCCNCCRTFTLILHES